MALDSVERLIASSHSAGRLVDSSSPTRAVSAFRIADFLESTTRVALLTATLGLCFPADGQAQKLSVDEQWIVSYVDAHTSGAVALLEQSVNTESPTEDLAGVRKLGMVFKPSEPMDVAARDADVTVGDRRPSFEVEEARGPPVHRHRLVVFHRCAVPCSRPKLDTLSNPAIPAWYPLAPRGLRLIRIR